MTGRVRVLTLIAISLCCRPLLHGEESQETGPADLPGFVARGIAHNPGLQAEYDRYEAALEMIPQARGLPDPKLTATHFVEEIQTRTGPQRNQISLGQTFPWFGKRRLRGEVASREADALHHTYEAALLKLVREIGLAYYDYAYLGKATGITGEIVDLLSQLEGSVEEKVRGGNDLAPLLRLQVEIARAQDMLQGMQKLRTTQNARLNGLLGRRPAGAVLAFPPIAEPDPANRDQERLAEEVLAENPELRSLRSRIDKAAEAVKLSKLSPIPDPTLGAGVFETGEALNPSTPGSGDDPWSVQVSFTIPFWFGKYKAEKREAEQRYEAARKTLTDRENMLLAEMEGVVQELAEVKRRLELYGDTLLPKARQAFEVTQSSYEADRSTILDLIDSERTLLEIERTYWRAVADHYQGAIRLQTLTGKRPQ